MKTSKWSRPRLVATGALVLFVLSGSVGVLAAMQTSKNPLEAINQKLDQILEELIPQPGAVTLYSPEMNALASGRQLRCSVLNASAETLLVTFEIRTSFSIVEGPTQRTIAPGASSDIATASTSNFSHCKVEFSGKESDVRGHFANEVVSTGGDTEMVLSLPLS